MKHIQKSKTYRKTLTDLSARKKTFSQLPYPTKKKIAEELGMDINNAKDRSNIGKLWGKHRGNRAMIKEAKEMVAVDKAEANAAAATAPAPQASNNNGGLEEAAKAALVAATNANQAVETLAGTVGEQGKQIADLKDVALGYGNRLTNVETRQDAADGRMDVAETRLDAADCRMDEMQETINTLTQGRPRQRPQQQPSPTFQLSAVGATDDGSGWASPSRAPSQPSAAANITTPRAGVAKKKSPPPSSSFGSVGGDGGDGGVDGLGTSPFSSQDKKPPALPAPSSSAASKKLFGSVANKGGGRLFSGSPPAAVATRNSATTGAGSVNALTNGSGLGLFSSGKMTFKNPPNCLPPILKVLNNVGGMLSWSQRSNSARYKITVCPAASTAGLTIHDHDSRLVLKHPIDRSIKMEWFNRRDDSLVWSARDYSQNKSGTVTTFQLRFPDPHHAAAFGEKFKEAQGMTPSDDESSKSIIPSIFVVNGSIDLSSIPVRFKEALPLPEDERKALAKKELVKELPEEHGGSLFQYTNEFFTINNKIRDRKVGLAGISQAESTKVRNISLALAALPLFVSSGNYFLFRSVDFEYEEDALKFMDLAKNDDPFVEPAFLSTTALPIELLATATPMFKHMNTYFAIYSKSGRYLPPEYCANEEAEYEVLFDLGTSFRVLSFEDTMPGMKHGSGPDQTGRYRIVMEEI